jgi:hypothetical protein
MMNDVDICLAHSTMILCGIVVLPYYECMYLYDDVIIRSNAIAVVAIIVC